MAKNLIPQIAKMLSVELGEEFKINKGHNYSYFFDLDGLHSDCYGTDDRAVLYALLCGDVEIIKLPWKPKIYDTYWTFKAAHINVWRITDARWTNNPNDVAALKEGWVYKTMAEAKAALPNVAKEVGVAYES
nr:MAG TPA: hypothetical protein [Caudoviricetes sp.]